MKKILLQSVMLLALFSLVTAQSIVGNWKTIDDNDGREKSIIRIYEYRGSFIGKVEKILDPDAKRVCDSCSGDKKNKPIEGMNVLWSMKKIDGKNEWSGGHILDPKNGKIYRAKIWLEGNEKLMVRGYLGPFYRTQTWHRAN